MYNQPWTKLILFQPIFPVRNFTDARNMACKKQAHETKKHAQSSSIAFRSLLTK